MSYLQSNFLVNNCQIDVVRCTVSNAYETHSLQPKFMELLVYLAKRYPEPVSRDELIEHIWQGNSYVGKKALTNAIWHLRNAFKQCDPSVDYIETLRKTGYRLCFEPQTLQPEAVSSPLVRYKGLMFAALICASLILAFSTWYKSTKTHTPRVEQITNSLGRELFPSVSPDGQWLVYSWRRLGQASNLYKKNLQSPNLPAIALTQSPFQESRGRFSADMHSLFYYRKSKELGCEVVQHSLLNDEVQILDNCLAKGSADIAVSQDGKSLAYVALSADKTTNVVHLRDLTSGQSRVLSCTEPKCNFRDESIAFSPDASQLVVSRNFSSGHEDLILIDVTTGEQEQLTSGFLDVRGVAWHPNLPRITFSVIEQGVRRGYHLDLLTKEQEAIDLAGFSYPSYGVDGTLYYHRWQIPKSIVCLNLDVEVASTPFPLIVGEHSVRYPAYSDVTQKIVFVSNESGFDELWTAEVDGSQQKQLTSLGLTIEDPSWSHSGRYIAFNALSKLRNYLYIYDLQDGRAHKLDVELGFYGRPTWSKDDKALFVSDQKQLYRVELASLSVEQLTDEGGAYAMAIDDDTLLYSKPHDNHLYTLSLSTKKSRVVSSELELSGVYGWHYHKQNVYFFKVKQGDYRISRFDMRQGKQQDLIRVQERGFSRNLGMSFVEQANCLLYSAYKDPQTDILSLKQ